MSQPTLFDTNNAPDPETIVLYAMGDFQSRKKVLAERELALDRLRGAFKRACYKFGIAELSDEELIRVLTKLGAKITEVPPFVAKHPYRITVGKDIAERAVKIYQASET